MTKDQYYEICEALGSEPKEEEIPVDFEDLPMDVQEVIGIYSKLRDEWDQMNGIYQGKNYAGILDIFEILEVPVEDRKITFDLIGLIDKHRKKVLDSKHKQNSPKAK